MKLKGKPGMLVRRNRQRRVKGKRRGGVWFRFDSDGFVELDDTKLTPKEKKALELKFEVVKDNVVKETIEEVVETVTDYSKLGYKELQKVYADITGKTGVGKKKADMLKEL